MKFYILILDFQISLPPIPQFENKSWNFIFSFWILKSHYRQYHSLKIKVKIFYPHFGFSNLTFYFFHESHYLRTWHYILLFYKTGAFYTYSTLPGILGILGIPGIPRIPGIPGILGIPGIPGIAEDRFIS